MIKNPVEALQWYLEKQGKFKPGVFRVEEGQLKSEFGPGFTRIDGDGKFSITEWVSDIPKPTDDELAQIIADFETYLPIKAAEVATKRAALLLKLGINEADLDEFKKLL